MSIFWSAATEWTEVMLNESTDLNEFSFAPFQIMYHLDDSSFHLHVIPLLLCLSSEPAAYSRSGISEKKKKNMLKKKKKNKSVII